KKEEGRRKKEEGRRKKEEGRRKKEEAVIAMVSAIKNVLTVLAVAIDKKLSNNPYKFVVIASFLGVWGN
ncbi:sugar ABC transporter ATP-binding protein, partial [Microcoleus sp. Pol7_A1]